MSDNEIERATELAIDQALATIRKTAKDFPRLALYFAQIAQRFDRLPRRMTVPEAAVMNVLSEFVDLQMSCIHLLRQSSECEDESQIKCPPETE